MSFSFFLSFLPVFHFFSNINFISIVIFKSSKDRWFKSKKWMSTTMYLSFFSHLSIVHCAAAAIADGESMGGCVSVNLLWIFLPQTFLPFFITGNRFFHWMVIDSDSSGGYDDQYQLHFNCALVFARKCKRESNSFFYLFVENKNCFNRVNFYLGRKWDISTANIRKRVII